MVTRQMAMMAHRGQIFYHKRERNADGTAARCRVSGQCQTWARRPLEFSLPVKYRLKHSFRIDNGNAGEWLPYDPTDPEAAARYKYPHVAPDGSRFRVERVQATLEWSVHTLSLEDNKWTELETFVDGYEDEAAAVRAWWLYVQHNLAMRWVNS
jgi:hypothetical protein